MESAQEPVKCRCCLKIVNEQDQFCTNCGFPLRGTEEEQKHFISSYDFKLHEVKELGRKTKNAQTTLFVVAGLFFAFGIIFYLINSEDELAFATLITNVILAAIFLALGFWSKTKPVASIISGLVLYILVQLISIVDNPENIIKGIIVKVIIIVYLAKGLHSALEVEKIKKQHNIS